LRLFICTVTAPRAYQLTGYTRQRAVHWSWSTSASAYVRPAVPPLSSNSI